MDIYYAAMFIVFMVIALTTVKWIGLRNSYSTWRSAMMLDSSIYYETLPLVMRTLLCLDIVA